MSPVCGHGHKRRGNGAHPQDVSKLKPVWQCKSCNSWHHNDKLIRCHNSRCRASRYLPSDKENAGGFPELSRHLPSQEISWPSSPCKSSLAAIKSDALTLLNRGDVTGGPGAQNKSVLADSKSNEQTLLKDETGSVARSNGDRAPDVLLEDDRVRRLSVQLDMLARCAEADGLHSRSPSKEACAHQPAAGPVASAAESAQPASVEADVSASDADVKLGDIVVLSGGVPADYREKSAIVTDVAAMHCTVTVLDESLHLGVGECWPNFADVTVTSSGWRIGSRVTVSGMRSTRGRQLEGAVGTIYKHPSKGHPTFVCKPSSPSPQLTLCVKLDVPSATGEKSLLLEPRFLLQQV